MEKYPLPWFVVCATLAAFGKGGLPLDRKQFPDPRFSVIFSCMDVSPYVDYHRTRIQASRERREVARKQALQALEVMQPMFAATPGLKRVYLFGSLARDRF